MSSMLRYVFLGLALASAVMCAGYFLQMQWALATWPWTDGRLSNIFVASIFAAITAPLAWVGLSGNVHGVAGGFVNLAVILGGLGSVTIALGGANAAPSQTHYGMLISAGAVLCLLAAWWAYRRPVHDARPITRPMRIWFVIFILLLFHGGYRLLNGQPGVMPWPIKPETSTVYGWVFLGASCSFLYPLLRPQVGNATAVLLGFLAYDVVLLGPFFAHYGTVKPEFRNGLTLYISALILTGLVAIWYLFISPATRVRSLAAESRA